MKISVQMDRGVPVLLLEGRLDARGAAALDAEIAQLRSAHIVLDMSRLDYLSSLGIRSLVTAGKAAREQKGGLALVGVTPQVARILEMVGLLGEFQQFADAAKAVDAASAALAAVEHTIGGRTYRVGPASSEPCILEVWGGTVADPFLAGSAPIDATLEELGIAFGTAGLGNARSQGPDTLGDFLAVGRLAAVAPSDGVGDSDFVVSDRPAEVELAASAVVGFAGPPTHEVEFSGGQPVSVQQILEDLAQVVAPNAPRIGFVVRAKELVGVGMYSPQTGLRGHAATGESVDKLDGAHAVIRLGAETVTPRASIALYLPSAMRLGPEKRLKIDVEGGVAMQPEWHQIIRRLYVDCSRVVLTQLTGGYMATTFRVASYDRDGRRLLPTVLKITTLELVRREEEAHRLCVQRFILNNSTTIMGIASEGAWGALRYNFLGVAGPESKLSWLLDYYRERSIEEVVAMIDRLYTKILKPWYGQPRWEPVQLYADHTPLKLFPNICAEAERQFGITTEQERIDCPELGITLPNPIRFLHYEYPRRAAQTRLWYQGINHGDLNLRNVLVDEDENLYVIDFSETRVRNIVSDFARMETVLKFQIVRMDSAEDLARLAEFDQGLAAASTLEEIPSNRYSGDDDGVAKAYAVTCRMRRYANTVTLFETDILPYWLAALEWTYSVICYDDPPLRKKLAIYSAAMLVGRILEMEAGGRIAHAG